MWSGKQDRAKHSLCCKGSGSNQGHVVLSLLISFMDFHVLEQPGPNHDVIFRKQHIQPSLSSLRWTEQLCIWNAHSFFPLTSDYTEESPNMWQRNYWWKLAFSYTDFLMEMLSNILCPFFFLSKRIRIWLPVSLHLWVPQLFLFTYKSEFNNCELNLVWLKQCPCLWQVTFAFLRVARVQCAFGTDAKCLVFGSHLWGPCPRGTEEAAGALWCHRSNPACSPCAPCPRPNGA